MADVSRRVTTPRSSIEKENVIQTNALFVDVPAIFAAAKLSTLYTTFGNPGLVIDTNFDVKNGTAIFAAVNGVLKTLGANTNFDTGTTATITANVWGIFICSWTGSATAVTWASASAQAYATEALAKAALGTGLLVVAAGSTPIGYVTVQAGASLWTAGTDALTTGAGGTAAATTTYYNDTSLNGTYGLPSVTLTQKRIVDLRGTAVTTQ